MGMFYRTIRMLEHGIKPVYVFDGKPPQLKSAEVGMGSDFAGASLPVPYLEIEMGKIHHKNIL